MPTLPIENLGSVGLVQDLPDHQLPPEAFNSVQNMTFGREGASKMQGNREVYATLLHAPYWLFPWKDSTGFKWLYVGANRIGQISGTTHSDRTRFTTTLGDDDYTVTASSLLSGTQLGDLPLWTYDGEVDPPQAYNTATARFYDLPFWPASTFCDQLAVLNRHVVALRVKLSGSAFNPRMVKWSQAADPGTYPSSWDETDPATGAGEVTLADTPGEIKGSRLFQRYLFIYKADSVIAMSFVGGQSVFRFDTVFTDFGALNLNCIVGMDRSHLVLSEGDLILHNGSTWDSVINDKNRQFLFNNINNVYQDKTQLMRFQARDEVWVCYADTTSTGKLNAALIWNYRDNTWTYRELADYDYVVEGFVDGSAVSLILDNQTQVIDSDSNLIDQQATSPVFDGLVAADFTNTKLQQFDKTEQFDGSAMTAQLIRTGLTVVGRARDGSWQTDLNSRKYITRLYPKLAGTGAVTIYVGGQEEPEGAVTWVGPFTYDPATDRYIDFRLNTRFFCVRFESTGNYTWSVQGYSFDIDVIGELGA